MSEIAAEASICLLYTSVIGSQIERKIGVRNTLFVAAVMFFCGFAGTGLFGNGSIAVVYGCYGVLGGLGVGIGYNSVIATTNIWFPDKVGFSSGVLMMGFGLGSLILGTLSVNLAPSVGLGTVFTAIGVVTALVVVVLSLIHIYVADRVCAGHLRRLSWCRHGEVRPRHRRSS